jgi:toxin FitB
LRKGVLHRLKRDQLAANRLAAWVRQIELHFSDRVLPIDYEVAQLWGELSSQRSRTVVDTLLAATALSRSLTLVTRNVRDVEDTGVLLFNPWDDPDLD